MTAAQKRARQVPDDTWRPAFGDFDSRDFDQRYVFGSDKRIYNRGSGRRVREGENKNTGYTYYRLTRNDGKRVCVSTMMLHGEIDRVGELYFVPQLPRGTTSGLANWPAYAFDMAHKRVFRIAFGAPRHKAVRIRPNKAGKVRMVDYAGAEHWMDVDELFAATS